MTNLNTTPARHVYGRELRNALIKTLSDLPAVQLVAFLQYSGVQQYFVRIAPHTPEAIARVDAAAKAVVDALHPEIATAVQWRVLDPGESLPSSAIVFRRERA